MSSGTRLLTATSATLACLALLLGEQCQGAVMFADNFNRDSDNNIDASISGMSATFPLAVDSVYVGSDETLAAPPVTASQAVADALTNVELGGLHLADGPNASAIYIDHNFVDATATRLIAKLNISNDGTADNTGQRWAGIGFGASQTEAQSAAYDFNASDADGSRGWRGHVDNADAAVAGSGFADLYVAWERVASTNDSLGRIALYNNGTRLALFDNGGSLYEEGDTLRVDLAFADFNAGTIVSANVFYAGSVVGSDTFAWDNDANYIGITARQNGDGWAVDNLSISLVPEPSSVALTGLLGALIASSIAMRKKLG